MVDYSHGHPINNNSLVRCSKWSSLWLVIQFGNP